ncbi:MAG: WG repeat-containing protein [Bacteroidales bacterium]|nr:WG repeat-containing protein [Bacteroidales bacterium]
MKKLTTTIILAAMVSGIASIPTAQAQGKDKQKEKVVVVDDESCGCELYFIDGIQTIERNGLFGFKREDGTVFAEPKYKFVDQFHGNYCIVLHGYNQYGLIDRNGKEIIVPEYEEINYPSDGMIRVKKDGLYGFFDTAGNKVIDFQYRTASGFNEDNAVVLIDFDSSTIGYGYINKKNELVIPAEFEYAMTFQEGYAVVKKYDRFGMIDKNGNEVVPCKYLEITGMNDGRFFAVDAASENAAMFDNRFKQLTGFIYERIISYNEGFYTVQRKGKVTFLDVKGKERFGMYDDVSGFYDGYSMVKLNGKYGIINQRGKVILPIEYDNSGWRSMEYLFSEGLAMVEKDGKYGFVNKQGKVVIPLIYESAHQCTEGLIPVQMKNMWGYIDKKGRLVCDFYFDAASYFEWGRAEVVYQNTTYKINTDGVCVKNCKTFPKKIKFNL